MAANVNPVDIKPDVKKAVNGFGSFKVALATVLTVKIVLDLATFFEYPPVVIEELSNATASAGLIMIRYMEERGQIEPTSIMTLLCALKKMCLFGIEMRVRKLYEELCSSDDHSKAQLEGRKNDLIKYAKTAYRKHYETAKPFPSMSKCKVNTIFVQGGIYCSALEGDFMQKPDVLESYNDILSSSKTKSKRTLIEADPGFGKSTLTSQFVYDWCTNNPESPLKDVEILIFLQLRQLTGVQSIYTAIKNSIVPKDEDMDEACIKEILKVYTKSVVMLFDSYDEYPDKNETETDIFSIIEMKMFQDILAIILTRTLNLPPNLHPETKRIRLTGFGVAERRNYVLKAVADDVQLADRIEEQLQRNPFLRDLCQVPLFSTMVAHIAHERPEIEIFSTVTKFFTYVIACVHNHMKSKKCANTEVSAFKTELAKLYRIAFEGLTRKNQQLTWENTYLVSELGQEFYDNYIRLGMFAQEVVFDISQCRYKTEARIWHKIICEFYASHHLVCILSEGASSAASSIKVKETLNSINPLDLQYVYRFACGLNKSAADIIIKHLQETKEGCQFAILCMLEQEEQSDQFRQSVKKLVSRYIDISWDDSKLLQSSTIQVLEVASANQIPISCVRLFSCSPRVDKSGLNLILESRLSLSILSSLQELWIYDYNRRLTNEELAAILSYSSQCTSLKELQFRWGYTMPDTIPVGSIPSSLKSRNVKVWNSRNIRRLNLQTGQWQACDGWGNLPGEEGFHDKSYQSSLTNFNQARHTSLSMQTACSSGDANYQQDYDVIHSILKLMQ
ncbi:uncharacterized protein [Apostichopus japonicus]|uniref:uncharacterized protein n=1 Tax=Stichopus japonicus TaxID=307972 RepID=UPI003AB8DAB4